MSSTVVSVPSSIMTAALADLQADGVGGLTGVFQWNENYYNFTAKLDFKIPTADDSIAEVLLSTELVNEVAKSEFSHQFHPFGYNSAEGSCRYFILNGMEQLYTQPELGALSPDDVWNRLHSALIAAWESLDPKTEWLWRKAFSEQWWALKQELEDAS